MIVIHTHTHQILLRKAVDPWCTVNNLGIHRKPVGSWAAGRPESGSIRATAASAWQDAAAAAVGGSLADGRRSRTGDDPVGSRLRKTNLVGGLEHEFYGFPYIGNNHPNCQLTFIFVRGVETTNQNIFDMCIHLYTYSCGWKMGIGRRTWETHRPMLEPWRSDMVKTCEIGMEWLPQGKWHTGIFWVCSGKQVISLSWFTEIGIKCILLNMIHIGSFQAKYFERNHTNIFWYILSHRGRMAVKHWVATWFKYWWRGSDTDIKDFLVARV